MRIAISGTHRIEIDSAFVEQIVAMVLDAMQHLDLIVFLPLDESKYTREDSKLRRLVDARLVDIFCADDFSIVNSCCVAVREARGSTTQRLEVLEMAIESAAM